MLKATTEPLRGAGLRDASTHPPRFLVQSGGRPLQGRPHPARWDVRPSSNPEASTSECFPRPAGEEKDKRRWRAVEKEGFPRCRKKRKKRGSLVLPAGVSSGPFPCWMASVASFLVPGAWCCVVSGGFESRHRTSSTRPHEADRCK